MARIVATEYLSLDGVFEEPGEWSFPFWSDQAAAFKYDELAAADSILLGRRTYEGFAAAWPTMTDTGQFGEWMNGLPKYVVSSTLQRADWNNSHIIRADVVDEIARLRAQPGRDILLQGSGTLLRSLMPHGLIDEYHIMLHPIVLGAGKRLFPEDEPGTRAGLQLVASQVFDTGITVLTYQPAPGRSGLGEAEG